MLISPKSAKEIGRFFTTKLQKWVDEKIPVTVEGLIESAKQIWTGAPDDEVKKILDEQQKALGITAPLSIEQATTRGSPPTLIQKNKNVPPAAPGKTAQETADAARRGEEKLRAIKEKEKEKESTTPVAPAAAAVPVSTPRTTVLESVKNAQELKTPAPLPGPVTEPPKTLQTAVQALEPFGPNKISNSEVRDFATSVARDWNLSEARNPAIVVKAMQTWLNDNPEALKEFRAFGGNIKKQKEVLANAGFNKSEFTPLLAQTSRYAKPEPTPVLPQVKEAIEPFTPATIVQKAPRQPTPGPVVEQEARGLELPEDVYAGYKSQPETPEFPEGSLEGLVESIDITPGGTSIPQDILPETGFTLVPKDQATELQENLAIKNRAKTLKEAFAARQEEGLVPVPPTDQSRLDDLRIKNQKTILKEEFRKVQQANRDQAAALAANPKSWLKAAVAGLAVGSSSAFRPEDKITVGKDSFTVVDVQDDGLMLQDDKTGETEEVLFQAPPQKETKQPPAPAPAGEAPEAPADFNTALVDSIRANEGTAAALRKIRPSDVIGQSDFGTYVDTLGNYTVGYGHFITPEEYNSNKNYYDNLSQADAEKFLQQDTANALQVASAVPNFERLNDNQKAALVDFTYNVGGDWRNNFPRLNAAFQRGDLNAVANELRNSNYYKQVGARAERNAAAFGGPQVTAGEVADPIEQAVDAIDKANQVVGARQAVNRKTLAQALQQLGAAEEEIAKLYADNPIPEIKDISNAKREAFQAYRAQADRNDMLAALDRALMAIGQFASAQAAMGTPFVGSYRPTAIDYDAKTQRALQEYKIESDILEEEQATSAKARAAKVDQLKTLADRIRDARKTAVTIAEKQVQIQEDEVKEGQGKVKQIFDLVRQSKQEQATQKKLEILQENAAKKQQDAAKKQDAKSQEQARKAQKDVAEYELGIVEQEIEKTKSILKAANSVNFEDDKNFPQQLSALANSLGVTPESLQSGQRIESVGVTPRPKGKTLGVFDEGEQSYLKAAVVPEVQKQVVTQLQSLEQKRAKLESDLKGLLQGTAPAGQEAGPSATVRTPAAQSRTTVWRKASDGKQYEYFEDTKQPTGNVK